MTFLFSGIHSYFEGSFVREKVEQHISGVVAIFLLKFSTPHWTEKLERGDYFSGSYMQAIGTTKSVDKSGLQSTMNWPWREIKTHDIEYREVALCLSCFFLPINEEGAMHKIIAMFWNVLYFISHIIYPTIKAYLICISSYLVNWVHNFGFFITLQVHKQELVH